MILVSHRKSTLSCVDEIANIGYIFQENFASTFIANEGLWQRLNLIFMYLPLCIVCVQRIIV
ncbi:MAG: hypothetical protein K6G09_12375, partial [Treponema sp.]|nr:hypothetical protein [Treponema sp.]